jgi:hypothetical protein
MSRVKTSAQADAAGAALDRRELAEATVSHWANVPALAARRMMEEYGPPDEVHADRLVWLHNSPWRRTVVLNERSGFGVPPSERDVVEQSVDYSMTPRQAREVEEFDRSVTYNPRDQALTSRADDEAHNFLRLNLADDIVNGRLTPKAASLSYASIVTFEQAGKTSPYLLGLRFIPQP